MNWNKIHLIIIRIILIFCDVVFGNSWLKVIYSSITGNLFMLFISDSYIVSKHCANFVKQTNFAVDYTLSHRLKMIVYKGYLTVGKDL